MWNDTDTPLGYLITFRTYGSWLHGDIRGSVDRDHNVLHSQRIQHTPARKEYVKDQLQYPAVVLDRAQRATVDSAIRNCATYRGWVVEAMNVRTNHIHLVITAKGRPDVILAALKANATRELRARDLWTEDGSPWSKSGSKKYLWTEASMWEACNYVNNRQGVDLTDR
jgi:REP element-mobilizing transposase RayT